MVGEPGNASKNINNSFTILKQQYLHTTEEASKLPNLDNKTLWIDVT